MLTKNVPNSPFSGFVRVVIVIIVSLIALGFFFFRDPLISKFKPAIAPSPSPQTTKVISSPFVSPNGTKLMLKGEPYQFTGVNAFHLATWPGANAGCGGVEKDLNVFFSQLRPHSVVRTWAFQGGQATNVTTKQLDWSGLDRVVNTAEQNNIKLILTLGDQSGTCDDGHWKDNSWYATGFKQVHNDLGNELTPLPYLDYVKLIVTRYKDSTAIAMWEPVNEPEAADCKAGNKGSTCYGKQTCLNAAASAKILRTFFDTVGGTIKSIDKNHLVSSGVIGDGQCGAVWEDYQYIHESPGIDVASYHDYGRDAEPMPGDKWNGLKKRLDQMKIVNKPLILGEVGILARDNTPNCMTYSNRRDKFKAKMDAQFAAGVAGFIPWAFTGSVSSICNYDIVKNDPTIALLRDYPVSIELVSPASSGMASASAQYTFSPLPSPLKPSPSPDIKAPTPPKLTAMGISSTQVNLTWKGAVDNIRVIRYDIFRNGNFLTSTTGTSFKDTGLLAKTTYNYHVKAKDAGGNNSEASNTVIITTP